MPKYSYKWFPSPVENVSVTCAGQVRSGKNVIKVHHLPNGPMVKLTVNGIRDLYPVDWLVAYAFLGEPPTDDPYLPKGAYRVAHINGDTSDCRVENLRWVPDPDRKLAFYMALMRGPDIRGAFRRLRASVCE